MDIGPDLETSHHHHHHTGRAWVDVVIAVSAILISLISLIVAIENGNTYPQVYDSLGRTVFIGITADF